MDLIDENICSSMSRKSTTDVCGFDTWDPPDVVHFYTYLPICYSLTAAYLVSSFALCTLYLNVLALLVLRSFMSP